MTSISGAYIEVTRVRARAKWSSAVTESSLVHLECWVADLVGDTAWIASPSSPTARFFAG